MAGWQHGQLLQWATVVPFVEANMCDCNRLAALRTDPGPVPMPRQHKRLCETDWLQRCVSASCTFSNLSVLFFNEILPFSFLPKPDMRKHNRHWWEKKWSAVSSAVLLSSGRNTCSSTVRVLVSKARVVSNKPRWRSRPRLGSALWGQRWFPSPADPRCTRSPSTPNWNRTAGTERKGAKTALIKCWTSFLWVVLVQRLVP